MTLRTHLIIVSIIILAVFIGWQVMRGMNPAPVAAAPNPNGRAIQIVRASWGLNCLPLLHETQASSMTRHSENQAIHENNILEVISALCNQKPQCSVRNSPEALGLNIVSDCGDKEINIEYRCFSYDRPWQLTVEPNNTGVVDCLEEDHAS